MRHISAIALFILGFILSTTIITAQPSELEPIYDPEILRERALEYNIVYFIAEDASTSDYASPDWIQEQLSVDVIHSWEKLLFYDDVLRIDSLIVHNSAVEMVDSDWLTDPYNRGLVLTAINMPATIFADLIQRDGLRDRYTLVEDDTVFITAFTLNVRRALDGTDLAGVAIWATSGTRVNRLSTEEGQISFVIMVNDIRELQHKQRYLIDDLLD